MRGTFSVVHGSSGGDEQDSEYEGHSPLFMAVV